LFGLLIGVVIVGIVLTWSARYSDAFRLEEVYIDGLAVSDWEEQQSILDTSTVFSQPLDSLAEAILARAGTYKVEVKVSLPHKIEIATNDFSSICFLLDRSTGIMVGLDRQARVVPIQKQYEQWEMPVITGVDADRKYHRSDDPTVTEVVSQLITIHEENLDLFRMIEEIDLSRGKYVRLYLSGLSFTLKVRVGYLNYDLQRFVEFATRYNPSLEDVKEVDLRFSDIIICGGSQS